MNCAMVILNYRDSDRAMELALRCGEFLMVEKIIIVDNCSDDGSYDKMCKMNHAKIDVIKAEKNRGFSAGNNIGAMHAVGTYQPRYLLFANTDTIFPEENLIACIDALESNTNLGLISTRMIGPDGEEQNASYMFPSYITYLKDFFWLSRRQYNKGLKRKEVYAARIELVDIIRGSFMFFQTEALVNAGYFDDNTFLYCEETIISHRFKDCGYKVALITNKYYIHDHIESKSRVNITSQKRLYESRYYYAVRYLKINVIQRMLMRAFSGYSIFEVLCIGFVKQCIKKIREIILVFLIR